MVKRVAICMVVSYLLCGCVLQTDEWPVFMHDPQHTGYSASKMPESLYVLWEFERPRFSMMHVIISKGKVIGALMPSYIFSLDITDGSLQWETRESIRGFPAVDKERMYIGAYDGILCLDTNTGDILWKYEEEFAIVGSPPVVIDEYLFVGSGCDSPLFIDIPDSSIDPYENQRRMLCLHAETGEVVWVFHGKRIIYVSPCYYNSRVYISDGHSVYCLDAETGELIWEKEIKGGQLSLSQNGKIFVGTYEGVLNCLQSDNGELLWQYDGQSPITTPPAVGYNKVFFGSENGTFSCVDSEGTLFWKQEIGPEICPPIVADRKVAVGAGNTLYILNAKSGEIVESYVTEARIDSIALSDGNLVVGEANGKVLCLGSSQKDSSYQVAACIVLIIGALVIYVQKRTQ